MTFTIHGSDDLGVVDCDYVAKGETAGAVADDIITHLRDEHDVDMPDADAVMKADNIDVSTRAVQVIVERLRDVLNIAGTVTTPDQESISSSVVPPGNMPGNL